MNTMFSDESFKKCWSSFNFSTRKLKSIRDETTIFTHVMNNFLRQIFHPKDKGSFIIQDMVLKCRSLPCFEA